MKKRKNILIGGLVLCGMLAACGGAADTEDPGDTAGAGNAATEAGNEGDIASAENAADAAEEMTTRLKDVAGDTGSINADSSATAADSKQARRLTEEELQAFTDYINGDGRCNYGFLLSVYDTPADIDLNEVFYSGAGIADTPMSGEETKEYLAAVGQEELYTEVVRIEAEKLDKFLLEKTGLTYAEMNCPLDWIYLETYDIYCVQHGDTNYQPFLCVAGSTADEKKYTLRFREDTGYYGGSEIENGYRLPERELVLEKQGDGYRFCSNRMVTEEGQITEQTFSVEVAGFGEVTFASYEPDYDRTPYADVTFQLLNKDGEVLQTLSGTCENNIRAAAESFCSVEAVAFPDYNGDGYTDALTIASYSYIQGPDVGEGFMETRVYSGNEYGYFYYEKDLSDMVNAEVEEPDIQKVRDFLSGINYYGTWKVTSCAGTTPVYALSQEEIDARVQTTVVYAGNSYTWNGEDTWISGYDTAQKTADEFQEEYRIPLSSLGVQAYKIIEVTADPGGDFGDTFFVVDNDTLLIFQDGVFFTAERMQ